MNELSDESRAVLEEAALDEASAAELEALRHRVYAALGLTTPARPGS